MSDKIFQTRIKLKYDSHQNWEATTTADIGGNLVLLPGELGIDFIAGTQTGTYTDAQVLFKVGDINGTPYKDLPYVYARAIDVQPWAKDGIEVTTTGSGDIVSGVSFDSGVLTVQFTDTVSALNAGAVTATNATLTSIKIDGTYAIKTVDVATQTDATYLPNAIVLGQQIVNKKYVDQIISTKANILPTDGYEYLSAVGTDGSYKRTGIQDNTAENAYLFDKNIYVTDGTDTVSIYPSSVYIPYEPTEDNSATNKKYVDDAILDAITSAVVFKGATATLPTNVGVGSVTIINGDMYKASDTITILPSQSADGNATITVEAGDTIIADVVPSTTAGDPNVVTWWYIPSADEDTWRPVQVKGTSLASNTVNFVDGSHTSVQRTTIDNVSSITFNHDAVGNTDSTYSASVGQYISGVKIDAYGHVSGITQEVLPTASQISVTYSGANISVSKTTSGDYSTFTVQHTEPGTSTQIIASLPGTYVHGLSIDGNGHIVSASQSFIPVASLQIMATGGNTIGIQPFDASGTPGTAANIYVTGAYDPTSNKVVVEQDLASAINALDVSITASGSATTSQISVFTKINEVDGKLTSTNSESVLLATVASTGKIDDLTQTNYVIFDCGNSTTVI